VQLATQQIYCILYRATSYSTTTAALVSAGAN